MKARLLRKLWRRYSRKYAIRRWSGGWCVVWGASNLDRLRYSTLDRAKIQFREMVRDDIMAYVVKFRNRLFYLNRKVTYYPW